MNKELLLEESRVVQAPVPEREFQHLYWAVRQDFFYPGIQLGRNQLAS